MNWSTVMFRRRRTRNGEQTAQARGNSSEAAAQVVLGGCKAFVEMTVRRAEQVLLDVIAKIHDRLGAPAQFAGLTPPLATPPPTQALPSTRPTPTAGPKGNPPRI